MRSLKMAAIGALLVGGQALGQSTFTFELALGGNNNVANWENSINSATWAFTGGNNADGASYECNAPGDYLTWSATVVVNGVHSVGGFTAKGAANIVFDLELHQGTAGGPLVAIGAGDAGTDGFLSTINDGDADGAAGGVRGADPLENAAFAVAFDAKRSPTDDGIKRGRLIDTVPADGPYMDYSTYPSTAGRPAASTAAAGTLVGMGAGYSQYTASRCPTGGILCSLATSTQNAGGVGDIVNVAGLGKGPIGEGQINMANVPSGTYVLVLVARKSGNNILGDFDFINASPGSFALGVDAIANSGDGGVTGGDTISFTWVNNCAVGGEDVTLTSAVSRRTHPANTPVVGDVNIMAPGASEPRLGGPTTLVLGFDQNVSAAGGGAVTCANIGLSSGACSGVSGSGTSELTVDMSGATPNSCLTVSLSNLEGPGGGAFLGPASLNVKVVRGDVDGDGVTNIVDLNTVKGDLFQGGGGALVDFLSDMNVDGVVNIVDLNDTKANLFGNVGSCP